MDAYNVLYNWPKRVFTTNIFSNYDISKKYVHKEQVCVAAYEHVTLRKNAVATVLTDFHFSVSNLQQQFSLKYLLLL